SEHHRPCLTIPTSPWKHLIPQGRKQEQQVLPLRCGALAHVLSQRWSSMSQAMPCSTGLLTARMYLLG
ncbi:unnamed protein product, partial [Bubo scandiacus]